MIKPTSARSSVRVTNQPASIPASTPFGHDFADDSCAPSSGTSPRQTYLTPHRLAQLDAALTDRDRAVLATLARVRVATARQLYRLHFSGVTRRHARACLASLTERRLIARLPRVVGGLRAGSTGYVFSLDVAGQRLTHPHHERPQRPWSVGPAFLHHRLSVTELYVQLIEEDQARQLTLTEFITEPACWRRFAGSGGASTVLKPDAAVRLILGRYEDHWWIEADMGTESRAALGRKCDLYRRYWQTGVEQAQIGTYPKVLWLVPDQHRHAIMADVLGRQSAEAKPLFAVALFSGAIARLRQGAGL